MLSKLTAYYDYHIKNAPFLKKKNLSKSLTACAITLNAFLSIVERLSVILFFLCFVFLLSGYPGTYTAYTIYTCLFSFIVYWFSLLEPIWNRLFKFFNTDFLAASLYKRLFALSVAFFIPSMFCYVFS